jgi:hypothetical protein
VLSTAGIISVDIMTQGDVMFSYECRKVLPVTLYLPHHTIPQQKRKNIKRKEKGSK